jgi:thiaminase (transcriptional activator TenA)
VTAAGADVGITSMLRERGADAWAAAVEHPMVKGIADGSLSHETFRRYFIQNVLYLEEYARAIGIIVGKAPDRDSFTTLTRFLARIVETEIPSNLAFLERLGGDPDTVAGRGVMLPVTYAYTRHLLSTCALGDCADGLTAVLPCQWSYGELARPLTSDPPGDPIFADWIGLFGNDEYDVLVARTNALLDRLVEPTDEGRVSALSRIFERSTWYEAAFWDMAYANTADPTWEGGGG